MCTAGLTSMISGFRMGLWAAIIVVFTVLVPVTFPASASTDLLGYAIRSGKPTLNLRYRFERVDDDAFSDKGYASTLRTAFGYTTARWRGVAARIEFQGVTNVGEADKHNNKGSGSAWNGVSNRPVIADPNQIDFNQAYLDWKAGEGTRLLLGRQEILLDNVRFVGNVGWRQFHQSFDAVRLTTTKIPGIRLTYAYVLNQNRIFADTKRMSSHLLNLRREFGKAGSLSVYGYLIDYDKPDDSRLSTSTFGAYWHGGVGLTSGWKGLYDLELAHQVDTGDNPGNVDANYYRTVIGAEVGIWTFKVGYELLEGKPGDGAFSTPFATLHAWNGWADKFLKTPADGLEDLTFTVSAKISSWKFVGVYHKLSADTGGAHYGGEMDLLAAYTSPWKQVFALKAAAYNANKYSTDTTKLWVFSTWKF
ncbi:MAG: alginate export family protein [Deltaproteobacteria bacterium]|nr:alginate export family protein [Deltaproteobacteria bacterium]